MSIEEVANMSAKKALKKLKKKAVKKVKSTSLNQLQSLKNTKGSVSVSQASSSRLSAELKDVANDVAVSALSELAAPLSPVLSWLNGGMHSGGWESTPRVVTSTGKVAEPANDSAPKINSIAMLPLKSPPCKRCPALSNGICKCAAKKFKLSA